MTPTIALAMNHMFIACTGPDAHEAPGTACNEYFSLSLSLSLSFVYVYVYVYVSAYVQECTSECMMVGRPPCSSMVVMLLYSII